MSVSDEEAALAKSILDELQLVSTLIDGMEEQLEDLEKFADQVQELARHASAAAAIMADSSNEDRAQTFAANAFLPLHDAIDDIQDAIGPAFLELSWDEAPDGAGEEAGKSALGAFSETADEALSETQDLCGTAVAGLATAMANVRSTLQDLLDEGDSISDDVGEACDTFIEIMSEGIPDFGQIVDDLVGAQFQSRLTELTENINAVLDQADALVSAAGVDVIAKIGGVMDSIEEINNLIQPLEPVFDAYQAVA